MYVAASALPEHSRIWIYQCSRELTDAEINEIDAAVREFLDSWTAHDQALKAGFEIRYRRFLILMIDEKIAGASGCSIDKSVHFIQSLEKKYGVSFLDRMKFAVKVNGRVELHDAGAFRDLIAKGIIHGDTHVFNNLIQTRKELLGDWEVPLKASWHREFFAAR